MTTATVPKEKIAEKAYEIFKSRGGKPGKDLDDWLRAEKELTQSVAGSSTLQFQGRKNKNITNNIRYGS